MLKTIQSMADALTYNLAKIDVQVEVLNTITAYVAGIDNRIAELNNIIKRAQEDTRDLVPSCCCSDKLSSLLTLLEVVLDELKPVGNFSKTHHKLKEIATEYPMTSLDTQDKPRKSSRHRELP
ncbi:hypothetical protein NDU88_004973 [Pleurodeles waltl]|uniref:Uncharacterized protein n=1 Tax=Pleurodeles waltl TaxID=8319 RepID=A0AAV7PGQ2_PLEWA|nr:hypothetical protein NDU88_004973 [Pleurodeles waltl]